ncbi:MAG: nucleotide sugar dehydrogenase [Phycisphaeraceae bacterium]
MNATTLNSYADVLRKTGRGASPTDRPIVCVQGLGFVGAAMATAVAAAADERDAACFNVVGVELDNPAGRAKIEAINAGRMPIECNDRQFADALTAAHQRGNLVATSDPTVYAMASVIVVDVPFDVDDMHGEPSLPWDGFRAAIRTIGQHAQPGTLVLVETTVPPGTCEHVVAPELAKALRERGLNENALLLAHSYERVMPGDQYFDSIVRFWRVYSGHTPEAADACERFLRQVIDVDNFPLRRLKSTTASELAKVMENSYRAVTIALMEEFGRFAEAVDVDIFEVVNAIRVRPTHSNMRQPGFGVGGYCLTKDPLMTKLAAKEVFGLKGMDFPFCTQAVKANHAMPVVSLEKTAAALGGLKGRNLLLLGVSYRQDVGDTRYSPSQTFVEQARRQGANVTAHDPLLRRWDELEMDLPEQVPDAGDYDAVVFAVGHREYRKLDMTKWLAGATPLIFDANDVLSDTQRQAARTAGCRVLGIGRGEQA